MQNSCSCVGVYHCLRVCVTTVALWCVTTSTYGLSGCLHTGTAQADDAISLQFDTAIDRGIIKMRLSDSLR